MNYRISRSHSFALLAGCYLSALSGCATSNSNANDTPLVDAGHDSANDGATSASASSLFGAQPSVQTTALPLNTTDLPAGYEGPTAENPITECSYAVASGAEKTLDDFEDLDENTIGADGRSGSWFFYDDETGGTRTHTITSDPTGKRAGGMLQITGQGFNDWGSGFGAGLQWSEMQCWYDASHYAGIRFWARGTGSPRVAFQNPGVRPVALGGACPDDTTCFDSHGVNLKLTNEWMPYELKFTDFKQAGWGHDAGPFDPTQLYVLEFVLNASQPYDIWLDDVSFFEAGDAPLEVPDTDTDAGTAAADGAISETLDGSTDATIDATITPAPEATPDAAILELDASSLDAASAAAGEQ